MTVHVGQPLPRREDARLLSGRGRYVDDVHMDGMLHAAVFRSSRAHGRILSIDVAAASAVPGVVGVFTHAEFDAVLKPIRPRIAAMPRIRAFSATAAGHGQGALCRRAHGRRGGDHSVHRGGRRKPDLGRHQGPAAGIELGAGRRSLGAHPRRRGNQHNEHRGRARRRGCGLQGCLLCAARALHRSPAYCRSLGGARAGCGMGRCRDAHDRVRHHQGALLQPHHARLHARSSRSFGRDEGGGRRRRIWCSRGILSGRLPDPRSGAAARPAGEMDRGPPRALSCDQSLARSHLRSGDRVRPGGNSSSGCAAR